MRSPLCQLPSYQNDRTWRLVAWARRLQYQSGQIDIILTGNIRKLLWAAQCLPVFQTVAGADDVVEQDELGEGEAITLAQVVAEWEVAELVESGGAQIAGLGHVRPDTILQFAGFFVADLGIDLQCATGVAVVLLHKKTQGRA